jgi:opacity protein-like surface antigen
MSIHIRLAWPGHAAIARMAMLGLMVSTVGVAITRAAEIVPSVGITRSAKPGSDDRAQLSGGVAVRGAILPLLESEIGVAYRSESRLGGDLKVRTWPVTASLWLTPIPALYAGGGVGWYHTTFDYVSALPIQDETHQQFGVHLGGGLRVPLARAAALDLSGRYVFLTSQRSQLPPNTFDPDYWTTTMGLAIRF